ncbi:MAG TPA: lipase maturation factor family protein, partial [Candidatus Angelobacter sp.]|nr:lipase maturation factor family protein [Candidatus Angelobacter sp.]
DPRRRPPQFAPYHLRLDWLMWFLPFAVGVSESGVYVRGYELWFMRFMRKLLENDPATLKLLRGHPFRETPPRYLRALFYQYRYTTWRERKETRASTPANAKNAFPPRQAKSALVGGPAFAGDSGAWWERRLIGTYMQPISLAQLRKV